MKRAFTHAAEPYDGYRVTRLPAEDAELTHVGPGTPGGEYLRRFWHPIALASEIGETPLPVRLLGEDLVLFRTGGGALGLLHRHCSHRGTSLVFGRPTELGIRCCYHGWHFAPDGRLLDAPGEPPSTKLTTSHFQGAYPVAEYKGLVFAYLGPHETFYDLPIYDTFEWPDTDHAAMWHDFPCNWLQVHENCMDPYHATWLHARHNMTQLTPAWEADPLLHWQETPLGLLSATLRRVENRLWVTTVDAILPNLRQTGFWEDASHERWFARSALSVWITPIDDTHSRMIGFRFFNRDTDPNGLGRKDLCGPNSSDVPGQAAGRPFAEQQADPGDWEANTGQRPIALHATERLGTTDRGVVKLRRLIRDGIRRVAAGERLERPVANADGFIPTDVHDSVLDMPERADAADHELKLLLQRRITEIVTDPAIRHASDRREKIRSRLKALRDELSRDFQGRADRSREFVRAG